MTSSTSVLLLSVGMFLGSLPLDALAAGIGTTSSKLIIPRIGINRSSKDNGGSLSYTGAEYATHRPYKVDFDLLQASDRSHELEMPLLRNNDILDESKDPDFILASDPTLRSRRRRRRQADSQQQQQFPPQQQQQQAPFQQLGIFQGPIPVQRQRPQYDNIHTKYPYPYPPTLVDPPQQPIQVVVPESGNSAGAEPVGDGENGATTDIPSDGAQTTLLPEAPETEQQQGVAQQQDPAPAPPGNFPDSPQESSSGPEVVQTTYNPAGMMSSSPLPPSSSAQPVDLSTTPPSQEQQPPGASQGGSLPISPDQQNDPGTQQSPPPLPPLPIQVQQSFPQQSSQHEVALAKRLREKDDEILRLKNQLEQVSQATLEGEEASRRLKTQLEQANLQVVSYEQENGMVKDQFMRSEEANIKLRDRVLQLENTNQHLQEQNGQLQQVTAEQRQQINGLKVTVTEAAEQLETFKNQENPLTQEVQNHRKEIEDFLIRIRKLGEENETCKKQVRLYQLKVNYIMEQQRQQQQQQQQQLQPQQKPQLQKKKQPSVTAPLSSPTLKPLTAADLTVHDDELDPELSRMDAEIAALQKNAEEVAAAIQSLPQPPAAASLPQQPENLSSSAAVVVPESAIPPAVSSAAVVKKDNDFPGEAVQVDPKQTKHKQQEGSEQKVATAADVARAESASRTIPPGSAPAWEQPAGF